MQNLATAAQPAQLAGLRERDTAVGTGTLTIAVGGTSTTITIDSTNNTLSGIAAAINRRANNPGVTASILTTTDGARLVLSARRPAPRMPITVTQSGGDGGLASLVYDPANRHDRS